MHNHGVPVDVVTFASLPRPASRSIREVRRVPCPDVDLAGFVSELRAFIRSGQHDMVIPTDDQTLTAITRTYDDFKDMTHIGCPPPGITNLVLNKHRTLEIATKCGIRVPHTILVSNSAELCHLVGKLLFPWVLKPSAKETNVEESKGFIFLSGDEVAARFPVAQPFVPPMLLQEYCGGVGVGVEMLLHRKECLAVFQHRRIAEFPFTGGFSVTALAEPPNPILVEQSLALLRALSWEGPAMVEFKVNKSDGSVVLMEVNGRYWGTISLPISAGINFPLFHWQLAHNEVPIIPANYAAGTRWRWTAGHFLRFHALLANARHSHSARKALLITLWNLPAALDLSVRDSLLTLSDPMPAIRELLDTIRYLLAYDLSALFKRFSVLESAVRRPC